MTTLLLTFNDIGFSTAKPQILHLGLISKLPRNSLYEGGTGDLDADSVPTWYGLGTMAGLGGIPMEAFRTVAVSPEASLLLLLPLAAKSMKRRIGLFNASRTGLSLDLRP